MMNIMAETEREIKQSAFVVISCLYYELLHEKIFVVFFIIIIGFRTALTQTGR